MKKYINIFLSIWLPTVTVIVTMDLNHHDDDSDITTLGFCQENCIDESHHRVLKDCLWCLQKRNINTTFYDSNYSIITFVFPYYFQISNELYVDIADYGFISRAPPLFV